MQADALAEEAMALIHHVLAKHVPADLLQLARLFLTEAEAMTMAQRKRGEEEKKKQEEIRKAAKRADEAAKKAEEAAKKAEIERAQAAAQAALEQRRAEEAKMAAEAKKQEEIRKAREAHEAARQKKEHEEARAARKAEEAAAAAAARKREEDSKLARRAELARAAAEERRSSKDVKREAERANGQPVESSTADRGDGSSDSGSEGGSGDVDHKQLALFEPGSLPEHMRASMKASASEAVVAASDRWHSPAANISASRLVRSQRRTAGREQRRATQTVASAVRRADDSDTDDEDDGHDGGFTPFRRFSFFRASQKAERGSKAPAPAAAAAGDATGQHAPALGEPSYAAALDRAADAAKAAARAAKDKAAVGVTDLIEQCIRIAPTRTDELEELRRRWLAAVDAHDSEALKTVFKPFQNELRGLLGREALREAMTLLVPDIARVRESIRDGASTIGD